jgi:GT2 family glycosyltransferase
MKKISFIIVNYKSREFLQQCVDSVLKNSSDLNTEFVIVNNDKKRLDNIFGDNIFVVEINKNIGFGASCNQGVKKATGEILCFLNPDARFLKGGLKKLIKEFDIDKKLMVIGPKIVKENGKTQEWSVGKDVTFLETIKNNLPFFSKKSIWDDSHKKEVHWVTGAVMFVKKMAFDKVGGFDENFFLYFEDIDLCKRIRGDGKKIVYFPGFKVMHFGGKSSDDRKIQKKEYYKSQDYYFEKWLGKSTKYVIKILRIFHF